MQESASQLSPRSERFEPPASSAKWETLGRTLVLDHAPFLSVEFHRVRLPDGSIIEEWPWVITPEFVTIVAVTGDGRFICFRQVKYAIEGTSLAPPGGYLDPGEDALEAARRELLEETGCIASRWDSLGSYPVDGNRGAGVAHLFLARKARYVQEPAADDWEPQELVLLSGAEVKRALAHGEFRVLPWAAAFALALVKLEDQC